MKRTMSIALLALGLAGLAGAQPSVYYKWKNTATGATICEIEQPGPQWERVGGPFGDENCVIPQPQ